MPLPTNLHLLIMDELRANIDQYWERMTTFQMMSLSVVDYIVPFDEAAQLLRAVSINTYLCIRNSLNLEIVYIYNFYSID